MADANPFDAVDFGLSTVPPVAPKEPKNPFDAVDYGLGEPSSSTLGAFGREAAFGVVPAAGGLAGAGAGAETGAAIGALGGPIGATIGGVIGGLAGGFGGGYLGDKAQDAALSALPDDWEESIQSQRQADQAQHPVASFLGGLAPYALTMRPGGFAKAALPANATALQRIMASPYTAHLFPGAVMGGIEAGNEIADGQDLDWRKVAISTGFGLVFNKPTTFGERIEGLGAGPVRAAREAVGREFGASAPGPTIAQAADAKVAGPGVTEKVFQGEQDLPPAVAQAAQETARQEQALIGEKPQPDLNAIARRLEPETFQAYEDLKAQRDSIRLHLDQMPDEMADRGRIEGALDQQLGRINDEIGRIEPDVQAAYRRAADMAAAETVEPERPAESSAEETQALESQKDAIAQDVSRQLVSAGRPQDEADAAGRLVAERYATRAQLFKGALGTAEELYRSEGAIIRAGVPASRETAPAAAKAEPTLPEGHVTRQELAAFLASGGKVEAPTEARPAPTGETQAPQPAAAAAEAPPPAARRVRTRIPQTLRGFVRAAGGIKDTGGDLKSMGVPRHLINNESGIDPDKMREAAAEAGYLGPNVERAMAETTPSDLYDALEKTHHYSAFDEERVAHLEDRRKEHAQEKRRRMSLAKAEREIRKGVHFPEGFEPDRAIMDAAKELLSTGEEPDAVAAWDRAAIEIESEIAAQSELEAQHGDHLTEHDYALLQAEFGGAPAEGGAHSQHQGEVGGTAGVAERPGESPRGHGEGAGEARGGEGHEPEFEPGAEGKPQQLIPGVEPVTDRARTQLEANRPLRGGNAPPPEGGLFDDAARRQQELFQATRGKIRVADGRRPIITLMRDADASTFIHETGHQWLEELLRDAEHEKAPDALKDDATTVRDWLKVNAGEAPTTRQHEKFARGFEQYMREGIAPSKALAAVFARFKNWLVSIYRSIKGLGAPINNDIRSVFDRILAVKPERTVIAPEAVGGPSLADIHAAEVVRTPPHEAGAAADRVDQEREKAATEPPLEIANEVASSYEVIAGQEAARASADATRAESAGEAGEGASGLRDVVEGGGGPESQPEGGSVGGRSGAKRQGVGGPETEGDAGGAAAGRSQSGRDAQHPLAASPAPLLAATADRLVDKAGNIRLDNLTTREDVREAIRETARGNNDFIGERRGVITDGMVMDLADDIGMDADMLNRRKLGEAFSAEQIIAARKLLIQSATNVAEKMKAAAEGTDQDVVAYAMAKDRHQMIQAQVAGITAEAGRALRAFRDISGLGGTAAKTVDQFIREATGRTLYQLKKEAKLGAALETPQQVSRFMENARKSNFGDMILEYWINSLISGPSTHVTYSIGNTILAAIKAGPETLAAAAIGRAREALGQERAGRVYAGESAAQFRGGIRAIPSALTAAAESFRAGVTARLPGEKGFAQRMLFQPDSGLAAAPNFNQAATYSDAAAAAFSIVRGMFDGVRTGGALLAAGGIENEPWFGVRHSALGTTPDFTFRGVGVAPLGTLARVPSRFIAAIHSFFRAINFSMEKSALAYRTAARAGLSGDDFAERVGDLWQNPTDDIQAAAAHEATEATLMGQGGEFTRALSRLTNSRVFGIKLLKFIDPFVHISSNIIEQAVLQRSPLGLLAPELRADIMGTNGPIAQDKATARMLVGTALSVFFGGLAASGYASGSGPSDPRQAAMWRLAGNQAHSVRIGDLWYDVHRLGPMGMLMGIAADMYDVAHLAESGDMLKAGAALQHALTQNILDESFMRGPADLIKAIEDPGRHGEAYISNWASSFLPYSVGTAQMARAADPYSRQARTVMDAILRKIPFESEDLFPRRDIWGEPIPNLDALGGKGVTAIYEARMSRDPVNLAMLNLGIYPAAVQRKIRNVHLTDQQYDDFARIAGRMAKMRLDQIVGAQQFGFWPPNVQQDVIQRTIEESREAARGVIMMKYPAILRQATQARIDRAMGIKPQ